MQDKKKLLILGALVVVVLGVGAFSFMGGSTPPPPAEDAMAKKDGATDATKGEGEKTVKVDEQGNPIPEAGTEEEPPKNPLYASNLPQRDPFANRSMPAENAPQMQPQPQPQAKPLPKAGPRRGGRRVEGGASYEPYRPPAMPGDLPLPNGNIGGGSSVALSPDPGPGYQLQGTMTGSKPIAVFSDSNGNQRLVPVGGSLDGDSKVVAVEKGSVTIEHRGKKQRLSLGGNPK